MDAAFSLFEFTEEDWDELLTRAWTSKIVPAEIAPGETLTIFGSAFTAADRILIDGTAYPPTVNPDQSLGLLIPLEMTGVDKPLSVRRTDSTESKRLTLSIKPQLDSVTVPLSSGTPIALTGHASLAALRCWSAASPFRPIVQITAHNLFYES